MTLHDTGEFYKKFTLKINAEGFEQFSTDEKNDKLLRRFGNKIFGLNKESRPELIPYLRIALKEELSAQSGLKL